MSVAERYSRLRAEIDRVARGQGRDPADVAVLAVTKFQPARAIDEAIAAGLHDFGENYLQEARSKFARIEPPVRKHFIGHVQTNKAKGIAALFDVVQSVDRIEAGIALAKAARALNKRLSVLVQVNVSPEERFGCAPGEAEPLARALRDLPELHVDGVMAIGPITADRPAIARAFERAAAAFAAVGGSTLSLGMSGDWREAVAAGSTMIRIGTSLFGPRPVRPVSKSTGKGSVTE